MNNNKNITIFVLTIMLVVGGFYHLHTNNKLHNKYNKTCISSVKKSEKISQLVKILKTDNNTCSDCGFTMWSDSWCEYHMGSYVKEIEQLKDELKRSYDYQIWLHEHSTPVVIGESR